MYMSADWHHSCVSQRYCPRAHRPRCTSKVPPKVPTGICSDSWLSHMTLQGFLTVAIQSGRTFIPSGNHRGLTLEDLVTRRDALGSASAMGRHASLLPLSLCPVKVAKVDWAAASAAAAPRVDVDAAAAVDVDDVVVERHACDWISRTRPRRLLSSLRYSAAPCGRRQLRAPSAARRRVACGRQMRSLGRGHYGGWRTWQI